MGLSFIIAAGPRQRSHSQVLVPRNSWPNFTVSDSRLPQPGGSGPRIYIPQEQGGPVIPPGIGLPFRRLLRLAGLRWRYSTAPQHGIYVYVYPLIIARQRLGKNVTEATDHTQQQKKYWTRRFLCSPCHIVKSCFNLRYAIERKAEIWRC
jgi:hypothetical protein